MNRLKCIGRFGARRVASMKRLKRKHMEQMQEMESEMLARWRKSLVRCDEEVASLQETLRERSAELQVCRDKVAALSHEIDAITRCDLPLEALETFVGSATKALHTKLKGSLEDAINCVVCMERPKTTMISPCNHVCLCTDCSGLAPEHLKLCPVCRVPISSTTTVYL